MSTPLSNKKVAILATDGFEQSELESPKEALVAAGATVDVVSIREGSIRGWDTDNWGSEVHVDALAKHVSADDYDALILPGGLFNPDALRLNEDAIRFAQGFFAADKQKPVAAICHGPWMLAEIDQLKGRKVTSYASIKTDLVNAGAHWVDEPVVCDNGLVTSRSPDDLNKFNRKLIEEVCEGVHAA